jgi:EAL domain-containing protein (putative c-di-GMP-specific phosphodiesterase class I)
MAVSTRIGIEQVIETGAVHSVYQPIVEVDSGRTVGLEALARGPVGTELATPDALFAAAAQAGLTTELDWECRAAALRGALRAGLDRRTLLFVNAEPSTLRSRRPEHLDELVEQSAARLNVVLEFTERGLADDPAGLVQGLVDASSLGFAVALDDVGANPASAAFTPILAPEIIKLDMGLVQDVPDRAAAAISAAVRSDAELSGSLLLAEGIEDEVHLGRAVVLGASLGQGWKYGRPAPLEGGSSPSTHEVALGRRPDELRGGARGRHGPDARIGSAWRLARRRSPPGGGVGGGRHRTALRRRAAGA